MLSTAALRRTRASRDGSGIFVDEDSRSKHVASADAAATLAMLSRRSGPLYLPRRRFKPSLIMPLKALVLLPGVGDLMPQDVHEIIHDAACWMPIPARSYEMNALLSLLRDRGHRAVPTAAVSCERRPVLLINPDFVEAHCRTDEHLFLLVMHELHHVLLGHTRLFTRPTPAHNLAFDAVINAMLVARFPQQAYTSFFTNLYGAETAALRLLAPPATPATRGPGAARACTTRSTSPPDVTAQEVFEQISRHAGERRDRRVDGCSATTTGRGDGWGTDSEASADFIRSSASIVEKWPPPEQPVRWPQPGGSARRDQAFSRDRPSDACWTPCVRALLGAAQPAGRSTDRRDRDATHRNAGAGSARSPGDRRPQPRTLADPERQRRSIRRRAVRAAPTSTSTSAAAWTRCCRASTARSGPCARTSRRMSTCSRRSSRR